MSTLTSILFCIITLVVLAIGGFGVLDDPNLAKQPSVYGTNLFVIWFWFYLLAGVGLGMTRVTEKHIPFAAKPTIKITNITAVLAFVGSLAVGWYWTSIVIAFFLFSIYDTLKEVKKLKLELEAVAQSA